MTDPQDHQTLDLFSGKRRYRAPRIYAVRSEAKKRAVLSRKKPMEAPKS